MIDTSFVTKALCAMVQAMLAIYCGASEKLVKPATTESLLHLFLIHIYEPTRLYYNY